MNNNRVKELSILESSVISVGLSSYDRPELLLRAIKSIQNQKYKNLEILVSDNGSSNPDVIQLIKQFAKDDARVKYFIHSTNKGTFFNFRYLLEQATGEYFIFLADDDFWSDNLLGNLLYDSKQSGAGLTYAKSVAVDVEMSDAERIGKELSSTRSSWLCLTRFMFFDTDSIIYGLFKTKNGRKLSFLLMNWNYPEKISTNFPFLLNNFPSYPFIFGLLAAGGFHNSSSDETIHYCGARTINRTRATLAPKHALLLCAYIWMHIQMIYRCIAASIKVGSMSGFILAPIMGVYLFFRRMLVAIRIRKNLSNIKNNT